ncbi:MAG: PDZ domain-containing protein [Planctomycetota bacterium]|nr:PDZ domain-containing protein [Planctomycetota bacterium]
MSGRITSIAVFESDPATWWAASASGGLLKTVNNGITFEHQFDRQSTVSIGDVQVAQSDQNILWVGTGEANPRNSVSWGDGVYKSVDGGKTWKNMGLKKTFQIGRIAIHPKNPNIVYVGALGRLWGPNEDRGLYKTSDGGKSWKKILYVNDKTGVVDVQMDLSNPDKIYVATYERKRDGFDGNDPEVKHGEGSAIYRTNDGGKTFQKLTKGLPTCKLGRIGLCVYRKDPKFLYAIVESEKIGQMPDDIAFAGLTSTAAAEVGIKVTAITKDGPAEKAGLKKDDIIVSANGKILHLYDDFTKEIRNSKIGSELKLVCSRNKKTVEITIKLGKRPKPKEQQTSNSSRNPRSRPSRNEFTGTLGGQAANRQDFQGLNGHEYGGIYRSDNYGDSWVRINSLNPRPMYYSQIRVDPADNQHIFVCGTSLYKSKDGGKTFTGDGGSDGIHVDHHALWIDPKDGRHQILGNDGGIHITYDRMSHWDHLAHVAIGQFYHVGISHDFDYHVYGGLQDNGSWGGPSRSPNGGALNSDWFRVGGGDGFICLVDPNDANQIYTESQNGSMGRMNLSTGARGSIRPRPPSGKQYRFNWKTPFILSPHNPKIHYSAGNHVFRSPFKGDKIKQISPEITNTDKGSGSAITESAVEEGVLFAGTTDGALWTTRDGGVNWINLFKNPEKVGEPPATSSRESANNGTAQRGPPRGGPPRQGGGFSRGRMVEMLLTRDQNKDGKITKNELTPEMQERIMARVDSNNDGVIDKLELDAFGGGQRPTENQTRNRPVPPSPEPEKQKTSKASDQTPKNVDALTGIWSGKFVDGEIQREFTLNLKLEKTKITGTYQSPRAEGDITGGKLEGDRVILMGRTSAELKFEATLSGDKMQGTLEVGNGQVTVNFEAARQTTDPKSIQDGGKPIRDLVPGPRWVSSLEASKFQAGRCYVTLDGHRSNDDEPYLFKTENYGKTWHSIRANLPTSAGSTRVIREDVINENLLFLGCEFSCWVSIDRGNSWTRLNSNLPTVAVHEIAIHPTRGEIVAATHGRSLWIMDITALRQLSAESLNAAATLYDPSDIINWRSGRTRGSSGTRKFVGKNPDTGTKIYYSLGKDAKSLNLTISNLLGETIYSVDGIAGTPQEGNNEPVLANGTKKGLHVFSWNGSMQRQQNSQSSRRRRFSRRLPTGEYLITLSVDGAVFKQTLSIQNDPNAPVSTTPEREIELTESMAGTENEEAIGPSPVKID